MITTISRSIGASAGDYVEVGTITSNGAGTYITINESHHFCGTINTAIYEFSDNYYSGATTDWMQVPTQNFRGHNGSQDFAIDVRRTATHGTANLEIRFRNISGACGSGTANIEIQTSGTYTPLSGSGSGASVSGYLSFNAYQFPVSNDRYKASTNGIFILNTGNVGIGNTNPQGALHVNGNFANQEITGANASAGQTVAWNAGATEISMGSYPAVSKIDDNTTNGSAILVVASITVSGNDLHFANGVGFYVPDGLGGYTFQAQAMAHGVGSFTVGLERRINGGGWTALTSQSAVCAMSIGDYRMQELGVVSQAPGGGISGNMYRFPNSVSISYFDSDAATGNYEYRLVFTPGGYNKNGGNYNITQRNLTAVQIKR
jgi:hypothetical protein